MARKYDGSPNARNQPLPEGWSPLRARIFTRQSGQQPLVRLLPFKIFKEVFSSITDIIKLEKKK